MTSFWHKLWRWALGENYSLLPAPESFPQPKPQRPHTPAPPKPPTRTILTGAGDTLFSLAEKHHTTVQAIISLNRINPRQPLRQGQQLLIPDFDAAEIIRSPAEPEFAAAPRSSPPKIAGSMPKKPQPKPIPPVLKPSKKKPVKPIPPSPPKQSVPPPKIIVPPKPKIAPEPASIIPEHTIAGIFMSRQVLLENGAAQHAILSLLETTPINTVVIDFKDAWGALSHPVANGVATAAGANRWTIDHLPALVASLRQANVTCIARIVALKDNLIAPALPHLAAQSVHRERLWQNQHGFHWLDPFQLDVWDYLLDAAATAARLGFTEIQFDCLRFPHPSAAGSAHFSRPTAPDSRVNALTAFLSAARGHLPANVSLSLAVEGYTCWRDDDFGTGQRLAALNRYVDVIAPGVYPSQFGRGIPGCADPLSHPAKTVETTVHAARKRMKSNCGVRPWLQDFPWDADGSRFDAASISAQIRGAFAGGANGFCLWNTEAAYSRLANLNAKQKS